MAGKTKNEVKEEVKNDLSSISPELIALLTNQIKAQLMSDMPKEVNQENDEEKLLNKKVKVTSISSGIVGVYLLNGRFVKWDKAGDSMMLKVEELVNMNSVSNSYLQQPLLMIEDDEVIEYLDLRERYDLINKISDIDKFLTLGKQEISEILDELPRSIREDLSIEIIRRIQSGEIDSRIMVEFLKRKLGLQV